jgi:hypothetical protein
VKDVAFREGDWQLLDARSAWEGNGSHDAFIVFSWSGSGGRRCLVAVNYAPYQSQCYVRLPWSDLAGRSWRLTDCLGSSIYDRDGADLAARGLYLNMPAWGYHIFRMDPVQDTPSMSGERVQHASQGVAVDTI